MSPTHREMHMKDLPSKHMGVCDKTAPVPRHPNRMGAGARVTQAEAETAGGPAAGPGLRG